MAYSPLSAEERTRLDRGRELVSSGQSRAATELLAPLMTQSGGGDRGASAALAAHPHPPFFLGVAAQQEGRHADAVPLFEEALRRDSTLIAPYTNLATCLAELGRGEEALKYAEAASALQPGSAPAAFAVGVLAARLSKNSAAISAYKTALEIDPTFCEAYVNLDALFLHTGREEDGVSLGRRAVALGLPDFWRDPSGLQRPPHVVPGLQAAPWHDAADKKRFPWVAAVEAAYPRIRGELEAALGLHNGVRGGSSGPWACVGGRASHDATLVLPGGDWKEIPLLSTSGIHPTGASLAPYTSALLASIPCMARLAATGGGECIFSAVQPGTHLRPHTGPSNTRLTAHLGLIVPEGATVTVGGETK